MQVGLIGLGKMGLNIGQNLIDHNHQVVAYDLNPEAVKEMETMVRQEQIVDRTC